PSRWPERCQRPFSGVESCSKGGARCPQRAIQRLAGTASPASLKSTSPVASGTFSIILPAMKYRRFGRTELSIPVFSCGGMRYQFKWQDVDPKDIPRENQDNLEATIRRALELGINHIETARGYGSSEMQLGNILPTLPRDKMIVQTKVAPKA